MWRKDVQERVSMRYLVVATRPLSEGDNLSRDRVEVNVKVFFGPFAIVKSA